MNNSLDNIKLILDSLPTPCALADPNKNIQWFNEPAQNIFCTDDINRNIFAFLKLDDQAIKEQITIPVESLTADLRIIPIYEDKNLKGYVLILSSTAEAQPISAHNLAHDLNNIFTSILNSIELLKKKPVDSDKYSFLLNNIESSSIRAAEIVEDVLSKEKEDTYTKRKINIDNILTEVANNLRPTLGDKITLQLNLPSDIKPVFGKYNDLFRVLINLCVNAKEAIANDGVITLTAENSVGEETGETESGNDIKNYVLISVKDNGSGIDKENITDIFNSGFSTKNKEHQSGLGLNIVKQIIEKHDGKITVESIPGEFTQFKIKLPAVVSRQTPEKSSAEKTILVAEDEFTLRELLVELLSSYNYNIIDAADGNEVIAKFAAANRVDLMIVDRKMPGLSGVECIKIIREQNHNIPIILASGSPTDKKNKIIDELKINRIVNKPYDFEFLLSNIEELIG